MLSGKQETRGLRNFRGFLTHKSSRLVSLDGHKIPEEGLNQLAYYRNDNSAGGEEKSKRPFDGREMAATGSDTLPGSRVFGASRKKSVGKSTSAAGIYPRLLIAIVPLLASSTNRSNARSNGGDM